MTIEVHSIVWDTDGKEVDLPTKGWVTHAFPNGYVLTEEDTNDIIDALSDKHGFAIKTAKLTCHDSD